MPRNAARLRMRVESLADYLPLPFSHDPVLYLSRTGSEHLRAQRHVSDTKIKAAARQISLHG